jgi:hypothetical protein
LSGQSLAPNGRGRRVTNLWDGAARFLVADVSATELTAHDYAEGIALALREDFAGASMVKDICRATGASVGIVKKWLAEENGPGGEYLIKLMAASPAVRAFVDKVTRRNDAAAEAEDRLRRALAIMEGRAP